MNKSDLSPSEWQALEAGDELFLLGKSGSVIAKLAFTGRSHDPGWLWQQLIECQILELYGIDHLEFEDPRDYKVRCYYIGGEDDPWIPRGDLIKRG